VSPADTARRSEELYASIKAVCFQHTAELTNSEAASVAMTAICKLLAETGLRLAVSTSTRGAPSFRVVLEGMRWMPLARFLLREFQDWHIPFDQGYVDDELVRETPDYRSWLRRQHRPDSPLHLARFRAEEQR